MHVFKWGLFFIAGLFYLAKPALADCVREDRPTIYVNMELGRVVVQPDAPVGTVVASKTWTTQKVNKEYHYKCTRGNYYFNYNIVGNRKPLGDNIFTTNIEGIGVRIKRGTIFYPYEDIQKFPGNKEVYVGGKNITLEIIKIAENVGTGELEAGTYTTFMESTDPIPALETTMMKGGVIIVAPSCNLLSEKIMDVNLPEVSLLDFKGKGSVVSGKDFDIKLRCSGGVNDGGYANINMSFSGQVPSGMSKKEGVLINDAKGNNSAKGIGVQVVKDNKPLGFDTEMLLGRLMSKETAYFTVPLTAKYYQYENDVSVGDVESRMVFDLTYD